jgi:hypothetical protein
VSIATKDEDSNTNTAKKNIDILDKKSFTIMQKISIGKISHNNINKI